MPSKPARYGLKSWVACDAASSYAWNMQMYTGKSASGGPERNLGARVVLDVTKGLRGPRNVTCDNFFTSYELARRLLIERRLTVVGTMRKNKPELPRALLNTKGRALFSSRFAFTPTVTLVSYVPKRHKNVLLLSTLHTGKARVRATRDAKPDIILHYNSTKGGVDNLDKLVGTYSCRRKTTRWPLAVFHNILDVSAYNAFVLWRELRPQWMRGKLYRRCVFLEQLGRALVTPLIERRSRLPRTEAPLGTCVPSLVIQDLSILLRCFTVQAGWKLCSRGNPGGFRDKRPLGTCVPSLVIQDLSILLRCFTVQAGLDSRIVALRLAQP
ncbi:uncharacterized protein LOC116039112 [Sander lucioperca]|uniref:uncharacterized protein LOC116039112 n=1 Tax=Sander lucioperca TaxID=283035 RepID=UPI00125E3CC1|nr:uncharacterized protein LOC116039112 [Sander lucioperca]